MAFLTCDIPASFLDELTRRHGRQRRAIAFQKSASSRVRKASSHPARMNFTRVEAFVVSFCMTFSAM
jgi:hypothetical protein